MMKHCSKRFLRLAVIFVLFSVFALGVLSTVNGMEYRYIGGRPANPDPEIPNSISWLIYDLPAGESVQDAIIVSNTHESAKPLIIYAADGIKSSGGGFAVEQYIDTKEEVGAWVTFYPDPIPDFATDAFEQQDGDIQLFCSQEKDPAWTDEQISLIDDWCQGTDEVQVNLEFNEEHKIDFVFLVPLDADVGEHTGGIIIQEVEPAAEQEFSGISLTTRVGIRIYETVPGDILKQLEILNFSLTKNYKDFDISRLWNFSSEPDEIVITTEVGNTGNVSVEYKETLTASQTLLAKNDDVISKREFQVLRDDAFQSNYTWEKPGIGKYSLHATISYQDSDGNDITINSDPIVIWIVPWEIIAVVVTLILAITIILIIRKKREDRKFDPEKWREYRANSGDTVESIAAKFKIPWKQFAEMNNLQPPYTVRKGQLLYVPKKVT